MKIFHGWRMVGSGAALQVLQGGLMQQSFGAYVVLLERDFGWSRTTLSGAFSIVRVEEGLLGPLQGWMIDRFGPRNVMRIGTITFAGGALLGNLVTSRFNGTVRPFGIFVVGYYAVGAL